MIDLPPVKSEEAFFFLFLSCSFDFSLFGVEGRTLCHRFISRGRGFESKRIFSTLPINRAKKDYPRYKTK
jgi:hypothetical protein